MMLQQQEEQPRKRLANESSKVRRATDLGYIVPNWTIVDYMRDAIDNYNWESFCIWGPKGSMKSNLLLQLGYSIYQDWDLTLSRIPLQPMDFIRIAKILGRIPWIGWDDIGVHLPRSLYYTDRDLWSSMKTNWDAIRTKVNVFCCTCPNKTKIVSFILDDLTGEVFMAKRVGDKLQTTFDFQRWMWSLNFEKPTQTRFEIVRVQQDMVPGTPEDATRLGTDLPGVPRDVFKEYWDKRVALSEAGLLKLEEDMNKLDNRTSEQPTKKLKDRLTQYEFGELLRKSGVKLAEPKMRELHKQVYSLEASHPSVVVAS